MEIPHEKFRYFFTSHGELVIAGKNSQQNEDIVKRYSKYTSLVLHTAKPASPFCLILGRRKPPEKSIKETAIFCACFSQAWKRRKKSVEIHAFKPANIYKKKSMKQGTFGVRKVEKQFAVKPELCIGIQKGELRSAPRSALKKVYVTLTTGRMKKETAARKIQEILKRKKFSSNLEKIMQLIPSSGISIQKN